MSPAVVRRKPTLADVASLAGVDRSVVSRILNDDRSLSVRAETRQRVLKAVEELAYTPNAAARSLRTAQARSIGLLIPDFSNPVYASIITGAEAEAARHDHMLLTASMGPDRRGVERYVDLLSAGRVDGLLLAGSQADDSFIDRLEQRDLPFILVNRRTPGARRSIVLDDEGAARLAVDHLVALGHRRIGHIAGPVGADTADRRRAGYEAGLRAAGIAVDERLVVSAEYTHAGGLAGARALLLRPDPPTAILAANAAGAMGALLAARDTGRRVPDDVSLVAIHDFDIAAFLHPPLTTVRMPLEELGRRGVQLLLERSATAPIREIVVGDMELVARRSTAPPPGA